MAYLFCICGGEMSMLAFCSRMCRAADWFNTLFHPLVSHCYCYHYCYYHVLLLLLRLLLLDGVAGRACPCAVSHKNLNICLISLFACSCESKTGLVKTPYSLQHFKLHKHSISLAQGFEDAAKRHPCACRCQATDWSAVRQDC